MSRSEDRDLKRASVPERLLEAGGLVVDAARQVARETGVPLLASIPIDPAVASGGDQGRPVVEIAPNSPAGEAYRDLAEGVALQLAALRTERGNYLESFSLEWSAS